VDLAPAVRGIHDALRNQLFHVYLVTYGAFRFAHEFMRDTPRLWGPFSGYQLFALATLALGCTALRACALASGAAAAVSARRSSGGIVAMQFQAILNSIHDECSRTS